MHNRDAEVAEREFIFVYTLCSNINVTDRQMMCLASLYVRDDYSIGRHLVVSHPE